MLTNDQLMVCADLCVESYADKTPPDFRDVGDLRYGVRLIDGTAYVCVRGTANLLNGLRDIWVRPSRICTGEWAHKGFASGFEAICKQIKAPGNPVADNIVWTGHSFGAAVVLIMSDVAGIGQCVTFGCPRPYLRFNGNPNVRHTRVRTDDDPVTMIPRLFYHMPEPGREIILKDHDWEWIDVKDHDSRVYRARLKRYLEATP